MALALREIEYVLELVALGHLPEEERTREAMGRRQDQLMYLVRQFEGAVKEATPQTPPPVRSSHSNSKMVWCQAEGCERALTREQAKVSPLCPECFPKTVRFKKPAAK